MCAAWFEAQFCSSRNEAPSLPEPIERSAVVLLSSSMCSSTRIKRMMQRRSEFATELEFEIETSRVHWSELESSSLTSIVHGSGQEDDAAHQTNEEIVESLQRQWPKSGAFFQDYGDALVVGAKIAEGAQVEIFEAKTDECAHLVLKVFKEGSSVRNLGQQWPLGMLQQSEESDDRLKYNMLFIARGIQSLHKDNIIQRDLKASNVLIHPFWDDNWQENIDLVYSSSCYACHVADYECSVGVAGTGFWRGREILQAVKDRNVTPDLFTRASDVYTFAMTCYEMITGRVSFEDVRMSDYDVLVRGERPMLPHNTKPWIKALLSRCWHWNPRKRPNF